jgi:hypothetical protein
VRLRLQGNYFVGMRGNDGDMDCRILRRRERTSGANYCMYFFRRRSGGGGDYESESKLNSPSREEKRDQLGQDVYNIRFIRVSAAVT